MPARRSRISLRNKSNSVHPPENIFRNSAAICDCNLRRELLFEIANAFADHTASRTLLPLFPRKGTLMKLLISHKLNEWREPIEAETRRRVEKMEKTAKTLCTDLVQLHGCIEKRPRKEDTYFL